MNDSRNAANRNGDTPREGDRIAKLLARAGVASRREAERMIAEGRVKLDGNLVETPATILVDLSCVTVDDRPVREPEMARLFAFHKPAGLLTTERDPAGRATVYSALRNALPDDTPRLMPVGRLDLNTEGLLLLTNDGGLKRALELPSSNVPRTYRARAFGDVSQSQLDDLITGVTIEGVRYGRIDANLERSSGRNLWIELTLREGKNREVRRVLEHLGLKVNRLIRVGYGPFALDELGRGQAVELSAREVGKLLDSLKVPLTGKASPSRPKSRPAPAPGTPAPKAKRGPGTKPPRPAAADSAKAAPRPGRKPSRRPGKAGERAPDSRNPRGPGKGRSR